MRTLLIIVGNIILLLLILFIYTMLWYYIGAKGKRVLFTKRNSSGTKLYWIIFWLLAFSFIIAAILRSTITINNMLTEMFTYISAISLAVFCYLIILFPITDFIKFMLNKLGFRGKGRAYLSTVYGRGISIFIVVLAIVILGFWNAINQTTTNYTVNVNKKAGKIKKLNVVLVSDVHMGIMIRENGIDKLVTSINRLKPDIVFFAGDMVDESTEASLEKYYSSAFKKIKTKYGVYSITGNHEYMNNAEVAIKYMEKAKVKVLKDEAVKVNDSFYVVGRNDAAGGKVKPLKEVLKNVDKKLPIIELNHRPVALEEAEKNGVDLQLSGHTHQGQVFPFNFTTELVFEDSYGYMKRKNFNLIVTSGYGTWGPPIRVGTKGEIVKINLDFSK